MRAEDVTPGSQIRFRDKVVWCLGKVPGYLEDYVLLGLKPGERPNEGWHRDDLSSDEEKPARKMLERGGYERGWWLSISSEVTVLVAARVASHSPGMSCRMCRDFATMAEPNRPDGKSFICWSCRQGWVPAGF